MIKNKVNNKTIFVLLASFRDPECETTINELFYKASNPNNIYVGVLWQYSPDDKFRCFNPDIEYKNNIKYRDILFSESKGVCWARNLVQEMYNGEDYVLIIDSHMLLEKNWDKYFIEELNAAPSKKAILSCYPAAYVLPDKKIDAPSLINACHSRLNRFERNIEHPYNLRFNVFRMKRKIENDFPIRAFFYAAGFAFGPSEFLKEIPYDNLLDWEEEEIAISLKLWTHGWDIYGPRQHYIYHLYHQHKVVADFRKAVTNEALKARAILSKKRFNHLLGLKLSSENEVLKDIKKYGLGNTRSIKSFELASGVNFKTKSSSQRSIDCWFALESKSHPLHFIKQYSLQKDFANEERTINTMNSKVFDNLQLLISDFNIKSIIDVGCGKLSNNKDLLKLPVTYMGIDIQESVVKENQLYFNEKNINFEMMDVTTESIDCVDLILLRDVLTFFTIENISKTLSNIKNSKSKYLLATSFKNVDRYRDLYRNGAFHNVDLMGPPFNFPSPLLTIEDPTEKNKLLVLYKVEDIPNNNYSFAEIDFFNNSKHTKIKSLLSYDESSYIASWKYYKNLENNLKILKIDDVDKYNNPILKRILFKSKSFFTIKNEHEIELNIFEMKNKVRIKLEDESEVLITLLDCDNNSEKIFIEDNKNKFILNIGDSVLIHNINLINVNSLNDSKKVFLIQSVNNKTREKEKYNNIKMTLTGDLILTRWMHNFYNGSNTKNILGKSYPLLQNSDINLTNLETVISNRGVMFAKHERNPYYFRTNKYLANFLVEANFNFVTTGNNHAMDFGEVALLDQKDFLNSIGIQNAGSGKDLEEAMSPSYINVKGTIIAVISFCSVRPKNLAASKDKPGVFQINDLEKISEILKPLIDDAKKYADIVIVSPHWIENWIYEPSDIIRKQARKLIDLGCDAIFGHSSHLLHGIEVYKNKPIVYDMGTFLVDNIHGHKDMKYTAIFELSIVKKQIAELIVYPSILSNGSVDFAKQKDFEIIFEKLTSLPENNFDQVNVLKSSNNISIKFNIERIKRKNILELEKKSYDDFLSPIPSYNYLKRHNSNFKRVPLQKGYSIIDVESVESCHLGAGFILNVAFNVGDTDYTNYQVHVKGISKHYNIEFDEYHMVSNGIIEKEDWKKGNNLIDEHFFRYKNYVKPGEYDIYWGLFNPETKEYIETIDNQKQVKVSTIFILPYGISKFASGIEWNGKLEKNIKKNFLEEFVFNPEYHLMNYIENQLIRNKEEFSTYSVDAIEQKYRLDSSLGFRTYLYIENKNKDFISWGNQRKKFNNSILRNIEKIASNKNFSNFEFDIFCKITFEFATQRREVSLSEFLNTNSNEGLEIKTKNESFYLLANESILKELKTNQEKYNYLVKQNSLNIEDKNLRLFLISSVVITKEKDSIKVIN